MSEKSLSVHYLPQWVEPEELRGATVVMIDTLRASTTIVAALANGAAAVIPLLRVEDVHARTSEWVRKQIVLGGEREGVKIDLFDLGNSPAEYSGDVVEGKTVLFTTTNGTRALEQCRQAHAVLIGALTNLSAICHAIRRHLVHRPSESRRCGEQIGDVHEIVGVLSWVDHSRPPRHGGYTDTPFRHITFGSFEQRIARCRVKRIHGSVIADPDNQRILGDLFLSQSIEQRLDMLIV